MSDRNAGQSGHRYGTRHTWHDSDRNPGVGARQHLLIAAREDERVTAFEAHDELARLGAIDQNGVDGVLRHRPAVRDLGGVDDLDVRSQLGEQFRRREPVGDHHVGLGQQAAAAHGDQFGITGTAADQCHATAHDVGVDLRSGRSPRSAAPRGWPTRMAAERRCSPPASTPTDSPA